MTWLHKVIATMVTKLRYSRFACFHSNEKKKIAFMLPVIPVTLLYVHNSEQADR